MATLTQPFFDPVMAELQRRLAYDVETGVADLTLRGQRSTEDYNLLMGTEEAPGRVRRQFAADARARSEGIAGRGFHGNKSGIMRQGMSRLAADQTDAFGQLHRNYSRQQEDIQRQISNLETQGIMGSAEAVRGGAGNASNRLVERLPF